MSKVKLNIADNVTPISAPHISKSQKEHAAEVLQRMLKEETQIVKGIFQCFETPGATVKISLKKYPEKFTPMFDKTMTDGMQYEVPLYVARHLNGIDATVGAAQDPSLPRNTFIGTCSYPKHGFVLPGKGAEPQFGQVGAGGVPVPIVGIVKRVKRFGFQSLEFAGAESVA